MLQKPRRPVDTYETHQGAERTVDHLSDQGFPAQRVAFIGQDACLVEQDISRMDYGRATLHGAASGALPGALIGWLFGLVDWVDPLVSALLVALYGVLFGAIVGALFGLLLYTLRGSRRDDGEVRRPDRAGPAASDRGSPPSARCSPAGTSPTLVVRSRPRSRTASSATASSGRPAQTSTIGSAASAQAAASGGVPHGQGSGHRPGHHQLGDRRVGRRRTFRRAQQRG
ncbi:general stress protein [Streptomyces sp. NPDC005262]|uniref:general stress protein n=1 Tax=Streptomyces sp. NPDC005262 TaxID=3364710 RepID=UPI0036C7B32A